MDAGGERMVEGGVPEVLDDIMALDTELFLWWVGRGWPASPGCVWLGVYIYRGGCWGGGEALAAEVVGCI